MSDTYYGLLERVNDNIKEGMSIDNAISDALDTELIYDCDIFELANDYLNGSDILHMFIEQLYNDLYNDADEPEEEEEEEEEE